MFYRVQVTRAELLILGQEMVLQIMKMGSILILTSGRGTHISTLILIYPLNIMMPGVAHQ